MPPMLQMGFFNSVRDKMIHFPEISESQNRGVDVKTEGFDLKMMMDCHGDGRLSRLHGHLHNLI